jgi:hypothetical protein
MLQPRNPYSPNQNWAAYSSPKFCVFIPSLANIANTLKLGMRWKTKDQTRVHTGDDFMDNSNALQVFPC